MHIKKLSVLFFIIVCVSVAGAAQNKVQIESDSLKYFGEKNISYFTGNVVVKSDNMTIHSDNMSVYFNDNREPEKIVAEGNVSITRQEMYALSKKAEMLMNENVIKLSEDVRVWQGENYLEGQQVIIYNDENRIEVKKSEKSRVKIIFYPDQKGKSIVNTGKPSEKELQKEDSGR
ncbi:MAG: lipopolysaccharide transport periplasmic protein LptA [Flexistipes sinusarabici]|uniref:Lipopolysaccharide transport periplasmic protein LptA n=1 Tax=Flexistipes sinusarabici TaxID=2352 RepID=A0A5D0MLP9_FLESI|nr:lipopolysaccharide transport periplasmic protein LptA [Flexistipes sinusarabici]TYB33322.1 MAG: lipopolysaccharide transport periplasmic protein LptA [Flexistipes sinusarabici]